MEETLLANESTLLHATIVERNGELYYVEYTEGIIAAKRAFSCLIEPLQGDTVLITLQGEQVYILSILDRMDVSNTRISVSGDLHFQAIDGEIGMHGKHVTLEATETAKIASTTLGIGALHGEISIAQMTFWGNVIQCYSEKVKLVGDAIESFFKRMFHHAEHSQRYIAQQELVHCKNINYEAEQMLQLRGKLTQISAPGDVFVTGERVHLG